MTSRIYPLPPSLVNQMAAGEVIERPASVVKELVENALDAGAQHININIEAAGVKLIEVSDDGIGIHPEDLPLTVLNHATSKIRTLDDLFSIESLGFRGEALSSIAGVSRFSLLSRQADSSEGYLLTIDEIKDEAKISPQARTVGSTVTVSDLFYNTPVRRQFLASEKTEWLQIESIVKRAALSRFDVAFNLTYKNSTLNLSRIDPDNNNYLLQHARIKKIFGPAFLTQSEFLDTHRDSMRLWGWVGLPSLMRSQNDQQYFYLNGRMVRDKLIGHAIRTAYEGHLYPGRQPVFILYLEMAPEKVDVNVHPTKHEVRFREQRQVHDFIYHQLSQIFNKKSITAVAISNHIKEESPSYNSNSYGNKASVYSEIRLQWLEPPYCLLQSNTNIFLCHYTRWYQSLCRQRFLAQISSQKVNTRPFLVPIRLTPSPSLFNEILKNKSFLEEIGLSLDALDEGTFIIRVFPTALPYLNIQEWLNSLEKKTFSPETLIESLIQSNIPPSASLGLSDSHETRALLNEFEHYIAQSDVPPDLKKTYKMMTPTDWEKVLKL
jgi:DNA mismatch repair protein MutL